MELIKAKSFFLSMQCSHIHMMREELELCKQYLFLNISHETETMWRQNEFDAIAEKIKKGTYEDIELWSQHAYLCELAYELDQKDNLIKLLEATIYPLYHLPKSKWFLVSENLNTCGNHDIRKSLISHVHRNCGPELAKEFLDYARKFSTFIKGEGMNRGRCLQSQKQCDKIAEILGL